MLTPIQTATVIIGVIVMVGVTVCVIAKGFVKKNTSVVPPAPRKKEWRVNDVLHREDGPAVIWDDGTMEWWLNGELHREDGPAITYPSGSKYWYYQGKKHRDNSPAVEMHGGTKHWYHHGELHRIDGPAFEDADGNKAYWIHNEWVTPSQFQRRSLKYRTGLSNRDLYL